MILVALAAGALLAGASDDVAKLGWLAGSWSETKAGVTTRETWLAPRDGAMSGVGQTHQPGKPVSFEFMKITAEPAGATFTAYVDDQPPVAFVLAPGKDGEMVFENKAHDFPQRVYIRRCGDQLCSGIDGTVNGKFQRMEWRYTRVRP
jgi:hypothetical protein